MAHLIIFEILPHFPAAIWKLVLVKRKRNNTPRINRPTPTHTYIATHRKPRMPGWLDGCKGRQPVGWVGTVVHGRWILQPEISCGVVTIPNLMGCTTSILPKELFSIAISYTFFVSSSFRCTHLCRPQRRSNLSLRFLKCHRSLHVLWFPVSSLKASSTCCCTVVHLFHQSMVLVRLK